MRNTIIYIIFTIMIFATNLLFAKDIVSMSENKYVITFEINKFLAVNQSYDTIIKANICQGETYKNYNFEESVSGNYIQKFKTIDGCDSVITLQLQVDSVYNDTINAEICEGEIYNENNFLQDKQGIYTDSLKTVMGCDSVVTLQLVVNSIYNDTLNVVGCGEGYFQDGFSAYESGIYTQNLKSSKGCDSNIVLNFLYVEPFVDTIKAEIYTGQKYTFDNEEYNESGSFTIQYKDINGCDSLYILDLKVIKLEFPRAITPNGDGINDIFEINDLLEQTIFDEVILKVYSRYGKLIYSNNKFRDKSDFWDPKATNTADGTFFYRFIAKGKQKNIDFTGSVEVISSND